MPKKVIKATVPCWSARQLHEPQSTVLGSDRRSDCKALKNW